MARALFLPSIASSSRPSSKNSVYLHQHPAFGDSDEELPINKALIFQQSFINEAQESSKNSPMDEQPRGEKRAPFLRVMGSTLQKLYQPRGGNDEVQFTILNEKSPEDEQPPVPIAAGTDRVDKPSKPSKPSKAEQQPQPAAATTVTPSIPPSRSRTRRYTIGEAPVELHEYPFGKVNPLLLDIVKRTKEATEPIIPPPITDEDKSKTTTDPKAPVRSRSTPHRLTKKPSLPSLKSSKSTSSSKSPTLSRKPSMSRIIGRFKKSTKKTAPPPRPTRPRSLSLDQLLDTRPTPGEVTESISQPNAPPYLQLPAAVGSTSSFTNSTYGPLLQFGEPLSITTSGLQPVTKRSDRSESTTFSALLLPSDKAPKTPMGLARYPRAPPMELPPLEVDNLSPDSPTESPADKLITPADKLVVSPVEVKRAKTLKKVPVILREVKISAPAQLEESSFLELNGGIPRTPPAPPMDQVTVVQPMPGLPIPFPTYNRAPAPLIDWVSTNKDQMGDESLPETKPSQPAEVEKAPSLAKLRFFNAVKASTRRFGNKESSSKSTTTTSSQTQSQPQSQLQSQISSRSEPEPAFPPLRYTNTEPIVEHAIAISMRVKEEFKLRLLNGTFGPTKDTTTSQELIEELGEINKEIEGVCKGIAKLLYHAESKTNSKSTNEAKRNAKLAESEMKSILNQFLVRRIFKRFSIELSVTDDDALREYYEEISSKVPQFIAARWRVLASSSTSRPIQDMTSTFSSLATEVAVEMLGDYSSIVQLTQVATNQLLPIIRHAYLLAHFINLDITTYDYDVYYGTEKGGWFDVSKEETARSTSNSKDKKEKDIRLIDARITGYCALGFRKRRFVGEGPFQRKVWDVLVKPKVTVEPTATPSAPVFTPVPGSGSGTGPAATGIAL